jgi:hypothetical protein
MIGGKRKALHIGRASCFNVKFCPNRLKTVLLYLLQNKML